MVGERLRALLRHYPTGITIVTVRGPDGPYGLTVNAFMSLSMNPPSVVVSLQREGRTASVLRKAGTYAVNLLGVGQASWVWTFADPRRPMSQRFEGIRWEERDSWIVLPDSLGSILVRVTDRWVFHDHELFAGAVEEVLLFDVERAPLIYWNREVWHGPGRRD